MYMKKMIFFFRLFFVSLLFLSPFLLVLCSKGGNLAMVARGEVKIGAVDKVVLVHVHSLRVGGLFFVGADMVKPMSYGGPPDFSLSGSTSSTPRPGSP